MYLYIFFMLISDWIQITNVFRLKLQVAVIEETCPREALDSEAYGIRKNQEVGYLWPQNEPGFFGIQATYFSVPWWSAVKIL